MFFLLPHDNKIPFVILIYAFFCRQFKQRNYENISIKPTYSLTTFMCITTDARALMKDSTEYATACCTNMNAI